jgi:hypothetical protein
VGSTETSKAQHSTAEPSQRRHGFTPRSISSSDHIRRLPLAAIVNATPALCRRPDSAKGLCRHYHPQNEVGRRDDRNGARFAVAEEPAQDLRHDIACLRGDHRPPGASERLKIHVSENSVLRCLFSHTAIKGCRTGRHSGDVATGRSMTEVPTKPSSAERSVPDHARLGRYTVNLVRNPLRKRAKVAAFVSRGPTREKSA